MASLISRRLVVTSALLTAACAMALPAMAGGGFGGGGGGRAGGGGGGGNNNPTMPASDQSIPAERKNILDQLKITEIRRGLSANMQVAPATGPLSSNNLETEVDSWPEGYKASITKPRPEHASTKLPELLVMKDGTKVTKDNWEQRKKEIYEDFDRELYGRVPKDVPKVTWTKTVNVQGNVKVIRLTGVADTTAYNEYRKDHPEIPPAPNVQLSATFNIPANATGPAPAILVMGGGGGGGGFGGGGAPGGGRGGRGGAGGPGGGAPGGAAPGAAPGGASIDAPGDILAMLSDSTKDRFFFAGAGGGLGGGGGGFAGAGGGGLGGAGRGAGGGAGRGPGGGGGGGVQSALTHGWGYGNFSTGFQADSGTSWSGGIIALTRKGAKQKPDDWGTLRAWAWGVTQMIDYLESDKDNKDIDPKGIAVEGHSRYGKAACVAAIYEPRLANAFVSSSGEGGAKIYRRNFGEPAEGIGGNSEFDWMCGNWQKYCGKMTVTDADGKPVLDADGKPKVVTLTVDDLPVDAHEFIALRAPKPIFISCGMVRGSELWQDPTGTFLGALNASPAWEMLGAKGLSTNDGKLVKEMPAPQTPLIGGDIGFRQHEQEHVDAPNWPTFMEFCGHYWKSPAAAPAAQ